MVPLVTLSVGRVPVHPAGLARSAKLVVQLERSERAVGVHVHVKTVQAVIMCQVAVPARVDMWVQVARASADQVYLANSVGRGARVSMVRHAITSLGHAHAHLAGLAQTVRSHASQASGDKLASHGASATMVHLAQLSLVIAPVHQDTLGKGKRDVLTPSYDVQRTDVVPHCANMFLTIIAVLRNVKNPRLASSLLLAPHDL
eukprot:scpid73274/ scgid2507/ 